VQPLLLGGSQEDERRAGTENLLAIAGLVAAFEAFAFPPVMPRGELTPLVTRLDTLLAQIPGVRTWGAALPGRLANTLAVTADHCDSLSLLAGLDLEGICASSGSACSVGSLEPSHVLIAMGASRAEAAGLVRFSAGRDTTMGEIECTAGVFQEVVSRVRK